MNGYLTVQGDVWDLISFKQYGDESFINTLINANPDKRHSVIFDGNVSLKIPDKPETAAYSNTNMPPWKR